APDVDPEVRLGSQDPRNVGDVGQPVGGARQERSLLEQAVEVAEHGIEAVPRGGRLLAPKCVVRIRDVLEALERQRTTRPFGRAASCAGRSTGGGRQRRASARLRCYWS